MLLTRARSTGPPSFRPTAARAHRKTRYEQTNKIFGRSRRAGHCAQATGLAREIAQRARTFLSARRVVPRPSFSLRGLGGQECPRSSARLPRRCGGRARCALYIQLRLTDAFFRLQRGKFWHQIKARSHSPCARRRSAADLVVPQRYRSRPSPNNALADRISRRPAVCWRSVGEAKTITVRVFDNATLTDDRSFRIVLADRQN